MHMRLPKKRQYVIVFWSRIRVRPIPENKYPGINTATGIGWPCYQLLRIFYFV
jgi:hypothetical protein